MDALKFLQTAKRICNTGCDKTLSCTGCCLHEEPTQRDRCMAGGV